MTDTDVSATEPVAPAVAPPESMHGVPVSWSHGQQVLHPTADQLSPLVKTLHNDGYHMCLDVTAADYLTHPGRTLPGGIVPERFEVIVTLMSHRERNRLRLRVQVSAEEPSVVSLFELHPGTEAMEREVFDLFGISFIGHPDLTRILMPEDWVGHPLRKDYDSGRIPVQFKGAPANR